MPDELGSLLALVLAELPFPARRWQLITVADLYGVDAGTRTLLYSLPARPYRDLADVIAAVAGDQDSPPALPEPRMPLDHDLTSRPSDEQAKRAWTRPRPSGIGATSPSGWAYRAARR